MANTYVDYTATAAQQYFAFNFPYLEDEHVVVEIEGVDQTITTNYTIETSPTQRINLSNPTTALAGGELVRIKRRSAPNTNLVDFQNGSVLTESELDRAYLHNRYLAEEATEGADAGLKELEGSTNFNANNKQIKNLADGTLATDAVNKQYVDTQIALTDTNLAGFYKSTHTGNAVDNVFTLSFTPQTTDAKAYIVSIDGLVQVPDTDYTIGATAITFNTIPANSAEICVVATAAASVATVNEAQVTATGSTIARSLANRFADVINVKDYGATGNGSDDDTDAFEAAITAAFVSTNYDNKAVYVPTPSVGYKISRTLNLQARVELIGESKWNCRIFTNERIAIIERPHLISNIYFDGVSIKYGTNKIYQSAWTTTDRGNTGVILETHAIVKECRFSHLAVALEGGSTFSTDVSNCYIQDGGVGAYHRPNAPHNFASMINMRHNYILAMEGPGIGFHSASHGYAGVILSNNVTEVCNKIEGANYGYVDIQTTIRGHLITGHYIEAGNIDPLTGGYPNHIGIRGNVVNIESSYIRQMDYALKQVSGTAAFWNVKNVEFIESSVGTGSSGSFDIDLTTNTTGRCLFENVAFDAGLNGGAIEKAELKNCTNHGSTLIPSGLGEYGTGKRYFRVEDLDDANEACLLINRADGNDGVILEAQRSSQDRFKIKSDAANIDLISTASASSISLKSNNDAHGVLLSSSGHFLPYVDNSQQLGQGSKRWSEVFAGTGVINTSDRNQKQQIEDLSQAELQVATTIKGLIKKFKFNDAVEKKGVDARIHVGVIAQDVEQAFISAGLNPENYGVFCRDVWWTDSEGKTYDEDGDGRTQQTQLGVRYEELFAFVIASM